MAHYIHKFRTEPEFQTARRDGYSEPWVSLTVESDNRVVYNKTEDEKLLGAPFTIETLGSGNITWKLGAKTVQYSKNGGAWETMNSATTISVVEGDEVQFKGTNTNYSGNTISATTQFNVKGNIMSLTNGDNFETSDTVKTNSFRGLFKGCTYLMSSCNLKLPATTLAGNCYYGMFQDCTSLATAPELPAEALIDYCYEYMFNGCSSLNYIKALFIEMWVDNVDDPQYPDNLAIVNWLDGVAQTGTFVKNEFSYWAQFNEYTIPSRWHVETTVPD